MRSATATAIVMVGSKSDGGTAAMGGRMPARIPELSKRPLLLGPHPGESSMEDYHPREGAGHPAGLAAPSGRKGAQGPAAGR